MRQRIKYFMQSTSSPLTDKGYGEIQGSLANQEVIPDHEILSEDKAGGTFTIGSHKITCVCVRTFPAPVKAHGEAVRIRHDC
ncbi:MAG: hypothetical protein ACYDAO_07270 [Thermoplasmataceae archaeon]